MLPKFLVFIVSKNKVQKIFKIKKLKTENLGAVAVASGVTNFVIYLLLYCCHNSNNFNCISQFYNKPLKTTKIFLGAIFAKL